MAKVEVGLLEAETATELHARRSASEKASKARMEAVGCVGMPTKESRQNRRKDREVSRMRSVELFAGAGGLALGIERAGFHHDVVVERDRHCCDTIRANQSRGFALVSDWRLFSGDARSFDYGAVAGAIDLVAGGPPCQPFSIGGKHKAHEDSRDMSPEMVRAVRELKPRAVLIENVKGLTRKTFANYFSYILLQLSHPEIIRKTGEKWIEHRARLESHHTKGKWRGLEYNIVSRLVNAADYGVPQKRERVFFVGFRSDLGLEWTFPNETHSLDALLRDQWVSGTYWERHRVARKDRPAPPGRFAARLNRLMADDQIPLLPIQPWKTVRDAISDLPDPEIDDHCGIANHLHNPGARRYTGHTGSPLDETAKALKAGDHGVPGGENTVVLPDGRVRYFTVRESARVQTFQDDYVFSGSWTESMRQLGNAVPVLLGQTVAKGIRQRLVSLR